MTHPFDSFPDPLSSPALTYAFTKTSSALSVTFSDGSSHTWASDNPKYLDAVKLVLGNAPAAAVQAMMDLKKAVNIATERYGDFTVSDDGVTYRGKPLRMTLTERILDLVRDGHDAGALVRFLGNLLKNPRKSAVDSLYDFLEAAKMPFTHDGCFLAFKIVNNDYMDIYSRTFSNAIGNVCQMEANEVDEDRNQTCSSGLHVCSKDYLPHYGSGSGGSRVVIVKVNPEHVVAVPMDYNNAKMRVFRYEVVGELNDLEAAQYIQTVSMATASSLDYEGVTMSDQFDRDHDDDQDDDTATCFDCFEDEDACACACSDDEDVPSGLRADGKISAAMHDFDDPTNTRYYRKTGKGTYIALQSPDAAWTALADDGDDVYLDDDGQMREIVNDI
jgi:hypothetical protein